MAVFSNVMFKVENKPMITVRFVFVCVESPVYCLLVVM